MSFFEIVDKPDNLDPLPEPLAMQLANELAAITGSRVYPRSISAVGRGIYFLAGDASIKRLGIVSGDATLLASFEGEIVGRNVGERGLSLKLCPLSAGNAATLRQALPWLSPQTLGLRKSFGFGDRLGLATPGHVRAARSYGSGVAPIFAQQSIREMSRSKRTPVQVLDEAMWGVFQEGWRGGYGADADHLKTFEDIDICVAAGFTFFAFDPGAYVDDDPDPGDEELNALPWEELETTFADTRSRYVGRAPAFEHLNMGLDEVSVRRAFVKYGRAVAQVVQMYRHLRQSRRGRAFEVEISVDETATATLPVEHSIIAAELRRLGVEWVGLAPRFVGRFEKGVDYIGDLEAFARDFAAHLEIAKHSGPYKLSLHSGSDKFSIYGSASRLAGNLVHLKTAGTSYLEALRTIARCDADLFRQIYAVANSRYPEERASYHVSADPARAPRIAHLTDSDLATILDQFDARQMLHVCFGSILAQYGEQVRRTLAAHEEAYYSDLERHFARHLESYCGK